MTHFEAHMWEPPITTISIKTLSRMFSECDKQTSDLGNLENYHIIKTKRLSSSKDLIFIDAIERKTYRSYHI